MLTIYNYRLFYNTYYMDYMPIILCSIYVCTVKYTTNTSSIRYREKYLQFYAVVIFNLKIPRNSDVFSNKEYSA